MTLLDGHLAQLAPRGWGDAHHLILDEVTEVHHWLPGSPLEMQQSIERTLHQAVVILLPSRNLVSNFPS